tara:strand:- start:2451 stop:2639 length:189 start_codon:yes stop_codon:yes gene_type:complete
MGQVPCSCGALACISIEYSEGGQTSGGYCRQARYANRKTPFYAEDQDDQDEVHEACVYDEKG